MKNEMTSFETQYREAALGEVPSLDLDFMQDLEKRLDEKKRRGGFFLDWLKGMALSITFLIYGMSSFLNEPNLLQIKTPSFPYKSLTHQSKNPQLNSSLSIIKNTLPQSENKIELMQEASNLPPLDSAILNRQELTIDTPRIGSSLQTMKAFVLGLLVPSQLNTFKTQRPQQTPKRKWEASVYSGVNFTKSYLYSDFNVVSAYDLKLTQSESVLTHQDLLPNHPHVLPVHPLCS